MIGLLRPNVTPYGYHIALGGGVLNNGSSEKDVDVYFFPLNGEHVQKPDELIAYLTGVWGAPEDISSYGSVNPSYLHRKKFFLGDPGSNQRRIDAFVLGVRP